jgi:hypothetical protein
MKTKKTKTILAVGLLVACNSPVFGQNEDSFETYQFYGDGKLHNGWEQRVKFHRLTDEFSVTTPEIPEDHAAQDFRFETFVLDGNELIPFTPPNLEEDEFFIGRRAGWEVSEFAGETFVLDVKTIPGGKMVERIEVEIPFYREGEFWQLYEEQFPDSVPDDDGWMWRAYQAWDDLVYWEHSASEVDSWWDDEFQIRVEEDANGVYCEMRIADSQLFWYNDGYEKDHSILDADGYYDYFTDLARHKLRFSSGQQLTEIKMRLDSALRFPTNRLILPEDGSTVNFHTSFTGGISEYNFGYGINEELNAFGTVKSEPGQDLKQGVKVVVYQDGMEFDTKFTDANGEYEFDLPLRHKYLFSFELSGYSNKRIEVDLSGIPIHVKGSRMMDLDMSMMPLPTGFDSSVFEEIYGRGEYVAEHNTVVFDKDHTARIREKVLAELARLEESGGQLNESHQRPQEVIQNRETLEMIDENKSLRKLDTARIDSAWLQGSLPIREAQRRWQEDNKWHISFAVEAYRGGNKNYLILSQSPEWCSIYWGESVSNAVSPAAAFNFTGPKRYRKLRRALNRAVDRMANTPSIRIAKIELKDEHSAPNLKR